MTSLYAKTIRLQDGIKVRFRPLRFTDTDLLWQLYATLSRESLGFLTHEFTRERIERWTSTLDYARTLPIVAVFEEHGSPRIVASASLSFYPDKPPYRHRARLGIAVHDDYQNRGLGTALTRHLLIIAQEKHLHKVSLGVRVDNARAIHVYKRCGFTVEATLRDGYCVDGTYYDDYTMSIFFDP
jgi:RimJ/RimL family protein N-acetyltransferase